MSQYIKRYYVEYLLPGAFIGDTVTVRNDSDIIDPHSIAQNAPEGAYGFNIIRMITTITCVNRGISESVNKEVVKTYFIDADIIGIDDVIALYGRDSNLAKSMQDGAYDQAIMLFSGEALIFDMNRHAIVFTKKRKLS